MVREINLLSYLPEYERHYREFKAVMQSEEPELVLLWEKFEQWLKNQFILSSDEEGIRRFEEFLGLEPFATDTLEERRSRVQAFENSGLPYTIKKLRTNLENVCTLNGVTVNVDYENYLVDIGVKLSSVRMLDFIGAHAENMVPMNMKINVRVIFNRWRSFRKRTWAEMRTATWERVKNDPKYQEVKS